MAAGTKWKRPWDDESQGGLDYSRAALRKASLSSNASGKDTPSEGEYDHGGVSLEERRLPPHTTNPNSMATFPSHILSPSPHRHVGLLAGSDERLQYHGENPLLYMYGHKRQRIEHPHPAGEASVHTRGGREEGDAHGLSPQDLGRSAERHETRERAMHLNIGAAASGEQNLLRRPSQVSEPLHQPTTDELRNAGRNEQCTTCSTLQDLVPCIVDGLCRLERELSVLSIRTPDCPVSRESDDQRGLQDIDQKGLCQSLNWVLGKVNGSIGMVRALITSNVSPPGQAPHAIVPYNSRTRRRSSGLDQVANQERYGIAGVAHAQGSPPQSDDGSKLTEMSSNRPAIQDRRNSVGEFLHHSNPSPHPSVSLANTILTRPQSPMQAPLSSRLLPSPSSMQFSTSSSNILPPMSPSLLLPKSPHTAHLQELQHQLSTKSLAHQILQGEHDKLLAAFSRSQIRCATLDKKSQVSDTEINDLSENNLRLQEQINAYEVQVENLQQSRDEAWKQSVASGAQYTQIMAMSSQLQVQGVADLRRWREDREAWEIEKRELVAKCESVKVGRDRGSQHGATVFATNLTPAPDHGGFPLAQKQQSGLNARVIDRPLDKVHNSDSIQLLREEITRLQERNCDLERALGKLRDENVHIEETIGKLGGVHRRIQELGACRNSQSSQGSGVGCD